MTSLVTSIEDLTRSHPHRVALIQQGEKFTYGDLRSRSERWRSTFREVGILKHDRIVLMKDNSIETAAAMIAGWAEGAIVSVLSDNTPPNHVSHALQTTGAKLIVSNANDAQHGNDVICLSEPTHDLGRPLDPRPMQALPTDPATIFFTSGSTGLPKGVVQSHGNLLHATKCVAQYQGIVESDILICPVPWSFDYGFGQLLLTLTLGITQVLPQPMNPVGICAAIENNKATILGGTAGVYSFLVGGMSPIKTTDISSIRLLMNTGGKIPDPTLALLAEAFSDAEIILNYGLTETYRSCYVPHNKFEDGKNSIGIPIPGVDIVIVDEQSNPVEDGVEGEIVHRGDYICLGYWNEPELTAQVIRPDPLMPKGAPNLPRALFTGDYGYKGEDGFFYLTGRRDNLIKSMGVRISTQEIETLIYQSNLVKQVAVFGLPHELMGNEVWAAIVGTTPDVDHKRLKSDLQKFCKKTMSPYMQPQRYLVLSELPETSNGKIDYASLKRSLA